MVCPLMFSVTFLKSRYSAQCRVSKWAVKVPYDCACITHGRFIIRRPRANPNGIYLWAHEAQSSRSGLLALEVNALDTSRIPELLWTPRFKTNLSGIESWSCRVHASSKVSAHLTSGFEFTTLRTKQFLLHDHVKVIQYPQAVLTSACAST